MLRNANSLVGFDVVFQDQKIGVVTDGVIDVQGAQVQALEVQSTPNAKRRWVRKNSIQEVDGTHRKVTIKTEDSQEEAPKAKGQLAFSTIKGLAIYTQDGTKGLGRQAMVDDDTLRVVAVAISFDALRTGSDAMVLPSKLVPPQNNEESWTVDLPSDTIRHAPRYYG